ncbi:hypothetical protein Q9K01_05815 [Qipengyuania sp. DY56-A-20]|jgi:hypothetical protein|uniref:Lipoprotein n=1 Tax=Qipengyuania benthica TaxID=3067651 RepID=A0ABT9H739_9SPHN|nr:hypothetical protein [Qipengyuania sp. DY56-A-20]MDP4539135.1 hypothetical protein [Qipengyuania sp. DY56-A-20]
MKKLTTTAILLAGLSLSGCTALLGAGAGAAAATCAPDDTDCVEQVEEEVDDI